MHVLRNGRGYVHHWSEHYKRQMSITLVNVVDGNVSIYQSGLLAKVFKVTLNCCTVKLVELD